MFIDRSIGGGRGVGVRASSFVGVSQVSPRIFNLMTNKIDHNDRNGHITRYFFHCKAITSSLVKVMGQATLIKTENVDMG